MKHVFYSLGITSFLVCMIFSVTTSITNPFYGMSEAAVAQATTYTQTSTGSENSSTDIAFVTMVNTQRFYVYDLKTYTITESLIEDSYSVGGSLSGGYKGIISASTILSHNLGIGLQVILRLIIMLLFVKMEEYRNVIKRHMVPHSLSGISVK